MITTVCLNTNTKEFAENCIAADISELREEEGNIIWADVSDPTDQDFEELVEEFGFHHLSIEDCQNAHQRPKVEEYTGYYFIVLYEAELVGPSDRLELRELNIFLGKNYLVTVHSRPIRAIATATRLWHEWTDRAEQGSGLLAYLLIDGIVDDYLPLLDIISERMDDLVIQSSGNGGPKSLKTSFPSRRNSSTCVAPLRRSATFSIRC